MTAVADQCDEFEKLGAEVLVISTDAVDTHKAWHDDELSLFLKDEEGFPYPMLSDPGGKIGAMYGVYEEERAIDLRGRFLIDPEGILQSLEIVNENVGRNTSEILRQIRAFQRSQETSEVMPADWEPGDRAFAPGAAERRVAELQIVIDEAKHKALVTGVLESPTFKRVREEAKRMRARRRLGEQTEESDTPPHAEDNA